MAVVPPPASEEALARWDGDGGSMAAPVRSQRRTRSIRDAERFLRFIRLTGVAEVRDGDVSFPPGILWPYTSDLRRVRAAFDAAGGGSTVALLEEMATLHERIAFAPGGAGSDVADAYNATRAVLDARGSATEPTRRCSRCRKDFAAPSTPPPGLPEQWWLCPPCHDKLVGKASRPTS
jgi:hypothetical protein